MNERSSLDAFRDQCKCGHTKELHWKTFGGPGACSASVDIRHPATGGNGLVPCPCKGFDSTLDLGGFVADGSEI